MAAKYQDIAELYVDMEHQITGDPTAWVGFLSSACRNYKCSFGEQLLIYAQRPDAKAVATLDTWNRQFRRWVNAGSKGIAVLADNGNRNYLKYYFDVSDTHEGMNARPVNIWQVEKRHQHAVADQMIGAFGEVKSADFREILVQSAQNLIVDHVDSYYVDLIENMEGSLFAEIPENQRFAMFRGLLHDSVSYMLFERCGIDPAGYFPPSDFFDIVNFNTSKTVNVLGSATSNLSEILLREVAQSIHTFAKTEKTRYDEENKPERSSQHETDRVYTERGLPHPESDFAGTDRVSAGQIRRNAPDILAGAQERNIHIFANELETASAFVRNRTDGTEATEPDHSTTGGEKRGDGADESLRPAEMDAIDEQLPAAGRGTDSDRADLSVSDNQPDSDVASQLTLFPSEEQQKQAIQNNDFSDLDETARILKELEEMGMGGGVALDIDDSGYLVVTPEEFQPIEWTNEAFLSEQEVNLIFRSGSGFANGKLRIQMLYEQQPSADERVKYLKNEYGIGGRSWTFSDGSKGFIHYDAKEFIVENNFEHKRQKFAWKQIEQRIQYLIAADLYLDDKEKDIYNEFQSSHNNSIVLPEPAHVFEPVSLSASVETEKQLPAGNYHIDDELLHSATPKERFGRNIAAIRMLQQLQQEQRKPTVQEQHILFQYCGWGSLPMAFDPENKAWAEEYHTLKNLLPNNQYAAARASTLTAFYTPTQIIQAVYAMLDRMGFKGGNILEPSCGIGSFFGLLPGDMQNSNLYGIELDALTGQIAQMLYPDAHISIQGFEENKMPDNYFDVAVGNVPFGDFKVDDPRYNKENFLIHDFFFAKALDKVRAGGVVAFITSKGTMDKKDPAVRKYLAQRADLIAAIRLPEDRFKDNAGTTVTTDIVLLQKRQQILDIEPDWVHLDTNADGISLNRYFVQHPEMICGRFVERTGRFGTETACVNDPEHTFSDLLESALNQIHGKIPEREQQITDIPETEPAFLQASPEVRNFSYVLVDDQIMFNEDGMMKPVSMSKTAENRVRGLIELRDCVRRLIHEQVEDYPQDMISAEQARLNELYDAFTAQYGLINSRGNNMAFADDDSYYLLCSLEIMDEKTKQLERKSDMFTKRTIRPHRAITEVETSSEALAVSIAEKAGVDLSFMAQLTGKPQDEIIQDLRGVIYCVPYTQPPQYVTADEYLSGNVREKLQLAQLAAKTEPAFQINADALKKVIPEDLSAAEISVRLGTTWIPQEDIQQFVEELLQPSWRVSNYLHVHYSAYTGDWNIEGKSLDKNNVRANKTYGTHRASAYRLIEDSLNLRDTKIYDSVRDQDGRPKPVLNVKETMAAQAKQERIGEEFKDWIWKDPNRRDRLVRYYNDTFNAVRPREYDGSHIVFGGMNPEITLRTHQINAVARVLYGGNALLAHVVGAGKTFEMIAAAQESKRLGLCNKSMIVVPNHLVGQWASEYLQLYPSANILVTTKKDFQTANRKKFCARIATGQYDAVIIGHSQFEKIPMSTTYQKEHLEAQIDEIEDAIEQAHRQNSERFTIKQLERSRKGVEARLKKLLSAERKDDVICFEELGVDRLFVDESHFYKNLFLYTKMRNVGGVAQTEAQKSSDLFMKCRYLDRMTGAKGIVFATGTPISNSMVEMYSVQRYLQYDTLKVRGLHHFDAWASTFGETVTALELAPEGTKYRTKTRFAKFYNLPELMQMFKEVADIQTADMLSLPVPKVKYHNVKTEPSEIQLEMVAKLAERADIIRSGGVDSSIDNLLLVTNDGRKLALDQRMIDPDLPDNPNSKINACVENVFRIWLENRDTRATQMIFSDLGTPKSDGTWNVYDDIRDKLVARGIPREQIVFIHEAPTDAKKEELFAKVRNGDVRVLIGSTQKMGAGTNAQTRLKALHNMDCPWRPSDLLQRQGRIERQGNLFQKVDIFRYVTEKTFDAYLYQLVESKQKFISQIMSSKSPVRSAEDVDEVALSFAEVKMLAAGDERIKQKMDLDIQVSRLRTIKQSFMSERYDLEDRVLKRMPKQIAQYAEQIKAFQADALTVEQHPLDENKFAPMVLRGMTFTEKSDAGVVLLDICKQFKGSQNMEIGSYRGFRMEISYEPFASEMQVYLCGAMRHKVTLGTDVHGNIIRLNHELARFPQAVQQITEAMEDTKQQLELAKAELEQPFPQEEELREKEKRLAELNIELNLNKHDNVISADELELEEQRPRKRNDRER